MKTEEATGSRTRTAERWRDPRFVFSIEIEVNGIDSMGRPFSERTMTRDVAAVSTCPLFWRRMPWWRYEYWASRRIVFRIAHR